MYSGRYVFDSQELSLSQFTVYSVKYVFGSQEWSSSQLGVC